MLAFAMTCCHALCKHQRLSLGRQRCRMPVYTHGDVEPSFDLTDTLSSYKSHSVDLWSVGVRLRGESIESPYFTVKACQTYPQDSINELIIWKNEFVCCYHNYCQIQIGIPACIMSSEYVKRTSLYLFRLQIFEWIKVLSQRTFTSNSGKLRW